MEHRFVHIPKTGGSFFCYTVNSLDLPIKWRGDIPHKRICVPDNDVVNIVIVRDPVSKFISAYNQYMYGTKIWKENPRDAVPADRILELIRSNRIYRFDFDRNYVSAIQFKPQSSWIPRWSYRNTILVYYSETLDKEFQELFDFMGFDASVKPKVINPPEGKFLTKENLTFDLKEKINNIYNQDSVFYYNIDRNRKMFKKVIGDING